MWQVVTIHRKIVIEVLTNRALHTLLDNGESNGQPPVYTGFGTRGKRSGKVHISPFSPPPPKRRHDFRNERCYHTDQLTDLCNAR